MSEWKEYKLGDTLITANTGLDAIKRAPIVDRNTEIKCLRIQDISQNKSYTFWGNTEVTDNNYSKFRLIKNDIIVARTGATVGVNMYIKSDLKSVFNNGLIRLRAKNEFNSKYIFYLLRSNKYWEHINSIAFGTTSQPNIQINQLLSFNILAPSLPTQTAIAEILSSLDDKIELNNKINKNLEDLAQTLFKQWFVDYEFPNENGEPYKSSSGEMVDSELGEIPKGWKVGKLVDIIDFNPTEKLEVGKEASYLDMSSLPTQGSWPEKPIQRIFKSGMKFRNGDTLFARITPCLENGKTAYIQCLNNNEIAWGSTEFIVMRPKDFWPKELAYLIARNEEFRKYAIQSMIGTSGRQRAQSSHLMNFEFIYPSDTKLIKQFADLLESLFFKIKSNSIENEYLSEIRDILLPKLISGELTVNDVELNLI